MRTSWERSEIASLGFLFASPFLLPSFSVLENVAMPLFKVAQVDAREAKSITETILDLVGIAEIVEVMAGSAIAVATAFDGFGASGGASSSVTHYRGARTRPGYRIGAASVRCGAPSSRATRDYRHRDTFAWD